MDEPVIQLLVFDGCPLADAARESLREALTELGRAHFEEINILDPNTAQEFRGWGSPTILIDGRDVSGAAKGDSVGCRLYDGPNGVPSPESIVKNIRRLSA